VSDCFSANHRESELSVWQTEKKKIMKCDNKERLNIVIRAVLQHLQQKAIKKSFQHNPDEIKTRQIASHEFDVLLSFSILVFSSLIE
jgi:hypothetical protein